MTSNDMIAVALESSAGPGYAYSDAVQLVPKQPGLYAFYGDDHAWSDLGLSRAFDGQPLYVGKAERSLSGRETYAHILPLARPARRQYDAVSRLYSSMS